MNPCPYCGDTECCIWGDRAAHGVPPDNRKTPIREPTTKVKQA